MATKCDQSIGRSMSVIYRHMNVYLKHRLAAYDLSPSEMMTLLNMVDKDGINQETLRDGLKYDKGVMARIVKKLVEKGYITKQHSLHDKRSFELTRSKKALDFEPIIFGLLADWNEILVGVDESDKIEALKQELCLIAERVIEKVEGVVNE